MQQELPCGIAATAAYVGSQGRNLFLRSIANRTIGVMGRGSNLELRAEIFDVFNTTNFAYDGITATLPNALPGAGESVAQANRVQPGQPFTAANAGTFGRATSTVGRTVGLGTNRQIQFAVRVGL